LNCFASNRFAVNITILLKSVDIWFRCHLTQSGRIGVRRQCAVRAVRRGEMGYLRASKYFSVPTGTLERYVKDTSRTVGELLNVNFGRTVLSSELENRLVEYCITMDQRYHGLKWHNIKRTLFSWQ